MRTQVEQLNAVRKTYRRAASADFLERRHVWASLAAAGRVAGMILGRGGWSVGLALALATTGCGENNPDQTSVPSIAPGRAVKKISADLAKHFPSTDAETERIRSGITAALNAKDYTMATANIQAFKHRHGLSFEQSQFLNGLMMGVQKQVASEVGSGNPEAARAAELLKQVH